MLETIKTYYKPAIDYLSQVVDVGRDNTILTILSAAVISVYHFIMSVWHIELFGVSNLLLSAVSLTVLWNTYTGVKKSRIKAKRALCCLRKIGWENKDTDKYKNCRNLYKNNKFSRNKLNFVFFKMFTFLAYLFFAKILLDTDSDNFLEEVLMFTSGLILKVPTAWFWYTEFKSVGENSVVIYGKKPMIFEITENIFEAKIVKAYKNGGRN